ncbi:glutamine-synthetase adenylyltransferase, partial [Sphingomonas sp.]|uniref:[protein-PII] uridylyltransferase family protein n=1 Tax=Sphingomonas sp. TaxID=28214 RepID=UPI001D79A0E1
EFFAQIHQLIHGGRDRAVRVPATVDALAALARGGWIAEDEARDLSAAYTLYRTIEHRVQMVDDRQTHLLPAGAALDGLAQLHGMADGAALLAALAPHVERTSAIYQGLEPEGEPGLPRESANLQAALGGMGFAGEGAATAAARIERWRAGTYPALRSAAAQEALEAVLPGLARALGEAPDPAAAILRLDHLLTGLPSALNFFRLLEAQPALARLLGAILSHAPPLAEALGRRPALFDALIDATALDPPGSVDELVSEMTPRDGTSYEGVLDHVRHIAGEKRFALGVQLIAATADPSAVGGGYARVAEAAIEVMAQAVERDFARRHGRVPDSELVVLALGRLGSSELTHASDLDLVYLFTGDYRAESDGEKPLAATLYYNRLAQRLTAGLSVPTPAGALYEIDTRLRPSGGEGPLVVSLDGFARYQREQAWTWEHMALCRARPVFGSPAARASVGAIIADVLNGDRPARDIVADAAAMRREMAAHKPPAGPLDVKLLPGGLVDLEFTVHALQLTHRTGFDPRLPQAIAALAGAGLAPGDLLDAHRFLKRLLIVTRLVAPDGQVPGAATQALVARALALGGWAAVMERLDATRATVAQAWHNLTERTNHGA